MTNNDDSNWVTDPNEVFTSAKVRPLYLQLDFIPGDVKPTSWSTWTDYRDKLPNDAAKQHFLSWDERAGPGDFFTYGPPATSSSGLVVKISWPT